ncbi:MAG: N-formylglutamate amidohydrolase [Pseudomonadota bacterium]
MRLTHPRAYHLDGPSPQTSAAVFNSPHSGARYTGAFLRESLLDAQTLRSSEDAFVDELFAVAPRFGAPLLKAVAPRAYVDLNRAETELDPAIIAVAPRSGTNPRLAAGLGVIPRVVSEGRAIRSGKMSMVEAQKRLDQFYHPYHRKLAQLIAGTVRDFGACVLFDCHSMPHDAVRAQTPRTQGTPDVVLGDRFGASCSGWIADAAARAFERAGFRVARNTPFAGGYITSHYGRPEAQVHALQIEVDRSLYMDEKRIERSADFDDVRTRLIEVVGELSQLHPDALPMAAE